MKFSMTGQEKGDLLIEVTAWAGLTVNDYICRWIEFFELNPGTSLSVFRMVVGFTATCFDYTTRVC